MNRKVITRVARRTILIPMALVALVLVPIISCMLFVLDPESRYIDNCKEGWDALIAKPWRDA